MASLHSRSAMVLATLGMRSWAPSGEIHGLHGMLNITGARRIKSAVLAHQFRGHCGIGGDAYVFLKTSRLQIARCRHTLADGGRFLAYLGGGKFCRIDEWDFDMDIDVI